MILKLFGVRFGIFGHFHFPCGYLISVDEYSGENEKFKVLFGIMKMKNQDFSNIIFCLGPFNIYICIEQSKN